MNKKVTLKHMQEDGRIVTRTTARPYTHVLLCKVNNKAEADALEATRQQAVERAAKDAKEAHEFYVIWDRTELGQPAPFRPGQCVGSIQTFTMNETFKGWAYDHVRRFPTEDAAIADAIAKKQAEIDLRIAQLHSRNESWQVVSWHHRAELAKPGIVNPLRLYKVEAINGGTRETSTCQS